MDGRQFDELTRDFVIPTRRSVIAAAATAVLTALIGPDAADDTDSPSTRFVLKSTGPYRTVDGVTVADDWDDLTDGALAETIFVTAGGYFPGNPLSGSGPTPGPTAPRGAWRARTAKTGPAASGRETRGGAGCAARTGPKTRPTTASLGSASTASSRVIEVRERSDRARDGGVCNDDRRFAFDRSATVTLAAVNTINDIHWTDGTPVSGCAPVDSIANCVGNA